ncbi:MAG: TIGR03808 family TAT-translocated repetitive protein [Methyloceanibacter sp.]
MTVGRREVLLGGLGLAIAASTRGFAQVHDAHGVTPGGGAIDQTAALQAAADAAAETGAPLFLPAGVYSTAKLTLKSGTRIEGVPGKTILRYREGTALIALDNVANVRLSGLVLDGDAKPLQELGALLTATETKHLDVTQCRVTGSTANGVSLRRVSGSIKGCAIGAIRDAGLVSEDADRLEIAGNLIERAACGIAVANFSEGGPPALIERNRIRNLFIRKQGEPGGIGIAVEADAVVAGNVIEGAPACGIMIGWGPHLRDVSVTANVIRDAFLGIGVSVDPSSGNALIAGNAISGAKDGAIRAMSGPASIGPDLATASAEAFANLAVYANRAG